ncbi:MAG: hypothetical protein ACI4TH_06460, partial [Candidatus Ornithomonoglobus sp.]
PVKGVIPEKTAAVGNGIWLSADDLAQAEYKETVEINGFYIGADDSADDAGKSTGSVTVDSAGSNGATVNGTKYYNRIKTGGKGDPETGVRCFYFTVDSDCTIVMDATSSSGSAARDVVVLHGDAAEHITVNEKAGYTVTGIKAGETVIIYSTEGGLNVYGISLTPESGGTVTELWTASEADAGIVAGTELLPGLTTLFDNTSTNKGYITGTDNGSIGGGVVTGTALKYEAYANGRLSVSVQKLDSDKTLYVIAEGGKADETATAAVAGVDGSAATIEASVEAGTTYYIWIAGSRGRFMAAAFTAE